MKIYDTIIFQSFYLHFSNNLGSPWHHEPICIDPSYKEVKLYFRTTNSKGTRQEISMEVLFSALVDCYISDTLLAKLSLTKWPTTGRTSGILTNRLINATVVPARCYVNEDIIAINNFSKLIIACVRPPSPCARFCA